MANDMNSKKGLFGDAATGRIAEVGFVDDVMLFGKKLAAATAVTVLTAIGNGVQHENAIAPLNQATIDTKAAHFDRFTPPKFMTQDANAKYTAEYNYDPVKNEGIGGGPSMDMKLS